MTHTIKIESVAKTIGKTVTTRIKNLGYLLLPSNGVSTEGCNGWGLVLLARAK
jgi:hypothetical protein